jgi:HD-GYP domain-containing protein (c-di-GMP phosphodiesterase class II)
MTAPNDQLLRCLFQTVGALVDTASLHDPYAPGHRQRTGQLARIIAQIQGFEEDVIDGIRLAATLHDFGSLLIPAEILQKPGPLNDDEWAIVKQHPDFTVSIFKDVDFPWPVLQMIEQHHERLDGSGYPKGLKKDEITLEAQVVAVADIIDAMTSDRPWRKALSVDDALDQLRKDRGVKFDAYVVDSCIELYTKQKYRLDPEYYGRG